MKNLIFLIAAIVLGSSFFSIQSRAQSERICGKSTPSLCVNEPIYYSDYFGKVTGVSPDGTYSVTYRNGAYDYPVSGIPVEKLFRASSNRCLTQKSKICNGYKVVYNDFFGEVVGISSNNTFAITYKNGAYNYTVSNISEDSIFVSTDKKCGSTVPKFCNGEPIIYSDFSGKIVGISTAGTYAITYVNGAYDYTVIKILPNRIVKTQKSRGGLACDDVSGELGDTPADVANSYNSLAQISTSERAEFLTEISKTVGAPGQQDIMTTLFARFVFAKVVNLSTSKAVKASFQPTVDQDQKELQKIGWKSIDQIEAQIGTLNFAARILSAAVKLRMNMPQMNDSITSFRSRLAMASADTRLSTKVSALNGIAQDMQPLLMELIQDPRNSSLGMVAQDAAGWILKN